MIYNNTDILSTSKGVKYYKAKKYPPIPPQESDVYVVTVQGDRLDLIAYQYYKDDKFIMTSRLKFKLFNSTILMLIGLLSMR